MEVQHGTLTPLIFSANGCMGPECTTYHKSLADKIVQKSGERYADVINIIRCKLSFIILRAAILCIRGSRRHTAENLVTIGDDFNLIASDAGMQS